MRVSIYMLCGECLLYLITLFLLMHFDLDDGHLISSYSVLLNLFKAIKKTYQNEGLLNIMEQLLGTPDIQADPTWRIRTKVPNNNSGTVPWHQGKSVINHFIFLFLFTITILW